MSVVLLTDDDFLDFCSYQNGRDYEGPIGH